MAQGLWITPAELGADYSTLDHAQEACESASFLLYAMSGRKYPGIFSVKERYCIQDISISEQHYIYADIPPGYVVPRGVFYIRPTDLEKNRISLRGKPVREVVGIYNANTTDEIDPQTYDVWEHSYVEFSSVLSGDVDVEYKYGMLPPTVGVMAARTLAIEFAKLWSGLEDECTLPERVTNVTRQGVSWTILDNQDFLDNLRTGVLSIDMFLKTVNPDKARMKSKVFSPDVPRGKRKNPDGYSGSGYGNGGYGF